MTKIFHYARNKTKLTNTNHWGEISRTGKLKTEAKVMPRNDGMDSDLLWFTADGENIAGGATNFMLQFWRTWQAQRIYENDLQRSQFNKTFKKHYRNFDLKFKCFVFDAEKIGAKQWNTYKTEWAGNNLG
jgi:hypothetical protein